MKKEEIKSLAVSLFIAQIIMTLSGFRAIFAESNPYLTVALVIVGSLGFFLFFMGFKPLKELTKNFKMSYSWAIVGLVSGILYMISAILQKYEYGIFGNLLTIVDAAFDASQVLIVFFLFQEFSLQLKAIKKEKLSKNSELSKSLYLCFWAASQIVLLLKEQFPEKIDTLEIISIISLFVANIVYLLYLNKLKKEL